MGGKRGRRISIDGKKQVEPALNEILFFFYIVKIETLLEWLMQG